MHTNEPTSRARVLLVEDDAETAQRFEALIRRLPDFEFACTCGTGTRALEWLAGNEPDVVLADLGLPDVSGIDVIRYAAQRYPDCDIMVITVFGDEAHVIESLQAGACGYLLKESGEEDLAAHLRELRAGGSPITPVIARQVLKSFRREPGWPDAARLREAPAAAETPAKTTDGEDLSERELQVLLHIAKGFANAEIAALLGVSGNTVGTYIKRIYHKLAVHSRTEAIYEARHIGLIDDAT